MIDYGESNCRFEFKTVDSKVCVKVTVPRRRISTSRRISLVSHAVDHRSVGFTDILLFAVSTFDHVDHVFTLHVNRSSIG